MTSHQEPSEPKQLSDFQPSYSCRFHPTDWWHEVGCPHREWTAAELQKALDAAKQSQAFMIYKLSGGKL